MYLQNWQTVRNHEFILRTQKIMTRHIDHKGKRLIIIEEEEDAICTKCGKLDELRPYGKDGERVCFDCAQADPEERERQVNKLFHGHKH